MLLALPVMTRGAVFVDRPFALSQGEQEQEAGTAATLLSAAMSSTLVARVRVTLGQAACESKHRKAPSRGVCAQAGLESGELLNHDGYLFEN